MKKKIALLVVIAIVLCSIPVIWAAYTHHQRDKLYEQYLTEMSAINALAAEPAPKDENYTPLLLGRIKIPAISLNMTLADGSTAQDLRTNAGHVTGTTYPGTNGNCVIAGHRSTSFGSHFNRLNDVKVGDLVTVEYENAFLEYEVYEIKTILPSETDVFQNSEEHSSIITLITCTPLEEATHRLVLRCKLIP